MNLILPGPLNKYNKDRVFRIYGNPDTSNFYMHGWRIMRDLLVFSQENDKATCINE